MYTLSHNCISHPFIQDIKRKRLVSVESNGMKACYLQIQVPIIFISHSIYSTCDVTLMSVAALQVELLCRKMQLLQSSK